MATRTRNGFTLVELLVVIMILGILIALLFPAVNAVLRSTKVARCSHNLQQLWNIETVYLNDLPTHTYPPNVGGDFWLTLTRTKPALLETKLASGPDSALHCPLRDDSVRAENPPGITDYRGPAWDINTTQKQFEASDPIGADLEDNHGIDGGGNLLLKAGGVRGVKADDPAWERARETTLP